MSDKEKSILQQIHAFKRKYVINLLLRGLLITGSLLMMLFLLFNYLEYSFQFGIDLRTMLFFSFIASAIALLAYYVAIPAYKLLKVDQALDNEFAARHIGRYFPEIRDKLINIIQLRTLSSKGSLAYAGLEQKMNSMPEVKFTEAIDTRPTVSLLPWFGGPLLIFLLVILIKPDVITESSTRIVNYGEAYIPQAPFDFVLQNQSLEVFRNDDLTLILKLTGETIADQVFISIGGRKLQMQTAGSGSFEYTLKKVQKPINFHFQAAGYDSKSFNVSVLNRPDLKTFNLYLDYPRYLNKQNEVLANTGNITIPEGTRATWQISAGFTDSVTFTFGDHANTVKAQSNNGLFELDRTIKEPGRYQINLYNEHGQNKDLLQYQLDVIPDMHPKIQNTAYQDTILYSFITLGGNISDDYGLSQLSLFYKTRDGEYSHINIPIDRSQPSQRYYYQWPLDSLLISSKELNYYLQVWDNDGVNGRKSAKTAIYTFQMPDKSDLKENLDKVSQQTEENIDRTLQEAKELREELKEAENRIKGKKELSWQDQKQIKDLIKKREELNQAIEELKQQNQLNQEKRNRFNKSNQQLKEKSEKLQELMNELLDDETKKLYEELKKLLEEKSEVEDIQDLVDKLNNKETNLEQELERTLELFKRMKVEHDLNQAIEELKDQIEQQEQLLNETEQAIDPEEEKYEEIEHQEENQLNNDSNNNQEQNNNLSDKQDQLKDSFEELKENLEQLNKDNQSLKNPESLPDTQEEQDEVEKSQQQSSENLKENKKSQSRENQKNARDAMKKMVEKMEQMQASMEMQAMQENLDDLRSIVYNLIQLSFDQEGLMEEFASVKQSDPRFVELSQKQLKLKDDSQIVQDSLLALAGRVFQIASFVTREVTEMNDHMDKSVEHIRDRHKAQAVAEQQFAMTSMNNLALLLDDVLQQMQNAMADAMGKPNKGKNKQDGPSLSELQQQLNQKIEDLKGSGKKGRSLSEELAKLAAEQERIREALEQAQEQYGEQEQGTKPGNGLVEKMEETEVDLVNKQITQETIRRQHEILSRLLEAEDAMRERELDNERKGETAKDYDKIIPDRFEEYLRLKEKEIEYLKTIPPKLYPYYKNEVNEYFKRLENQ